MGIAVTGLGIICAIGNDAASVLGSLKAKQTGIGPMRYLQSNHKELPVGEVKLSNEEMKQMLGVDANAVISRTVLMGAIAIRQALDNSNLTNSKFKEGKRVVVISGTTVGGMDITEQYFMQIKEDNALLPILEKHDCGSSTREMADLAGLNDAEVCTVSTACSSAVNAIILGAEMLQNNEADIVIAGGTEALSRFHLNGFNSLMVLDKECCRPFDKDRAGLNLGEGAAFIVLQKRPESEGIFIRGYANRCDAFHQTASSENGEGAYLAMSKTLQMAGLRPQDIQYINAHGTGTPNNDSSESAAIRRVFGRDIPPVSSTKGFTGHTTSASGSIETVICILALQNRFVPANLGWREQDEACITPTQGIDNISLENILCNSFGFGGNDSALVISKEQGAGSEEQEDKSINFLVQRAEATILSPSGELDGGTLRKYISSGEARRMTRLMKAATITSLKALQEAGVESPDAIITATAYGMLETSEKFLIDMLENGEETLSPTLFMQSTHNTLSSAIAIRTKCHGYNMTYTQGKDSLDWALRDARRLIASGKAKTVLVGSHDEATPTFQEFFRRMGKPVPPMLYSKSIVLTAVKR
ncbi:MAG: beta-ketoacyl-[acyl-carrier-protein] synthase family protein [Bacteroidaceae bacterium]|nr:beta-ketoacyl-[acyl-carrier-protein] synthase family protein [Bacteroidaceae bacterium]